MTQQYNKIPGHQTLNRKDYVAKYMVNYAKKYQDQPQCFSNKKFFPKTWILTETDQCKDFFYNYFNTQEYVELKEKYRIVYIRKVGAGEHRAKGVQPVTEGEEVSLRELYKNGSKCGKEATNYLIQTFVPNPLLVYGHKFDFRIYMLVASTYPLILYYHDGFLRVSLR